ncbi:MULTISPECIES: Crp/Fnr family transcriptional regulator [unclassified Bosea (in: a-proteobacteria)]|uniref:Crp/Fnr family transcriptional regulator n=1 Tax=unclassified Bosea (in: a-proteobacteria) TaxID=2653178 RepID=UPI0009574B6E|nr:MULTISPECIES: Crp/Fnr family transcriptional regulator [unclassified Bosea (in: a-proteobacteria)]TAJ33532.1 MAG: Crp/Fnr family transcriptional regulator [Bosea sp. (in: a-proteobacteria)]SIQ92963.1 cAMP-binding domain of CRP or a regulatory subunit of cAMP-dependent protein kinases [Bosea sp. TND4EK4]
MNQMMRHGRVGTPCLACPLRLKPAFKDKTDDEIRFIQAMKTDHRILPAGSDIIHPGQDDAELYTLFSGWAFRYKSLPDGRRQILNFLLPGDLVGLQASLLSAAEHGIEALTEVEVCTFPRKRIWDLFVKMPNLAYELSWLGSREECMVDDNLTSVGQRNAGERIAALVITLFHRADALGLVSQGSFEFPLSQQQLADALGLSLVHTSKTWSRLRKAGLFALSGGRLTLLNPRLTAHMAAIYNRPAGVRPLI